MMPSITDDRVTAVGPPSLTRLFLVETQSHDREAVVRCLNRLPDLHLVGEADSLGAALSRLRDCPAEVVLLDLNLPDSGGLDTVRRFIAECPDQPVIALTGFSASDEQGRQAIAAGAQDFLSKTGLTPGILMKSVSFAVERAKRRDADYRAVTLRRELDLVTSMQRRLLPAPLPKLDGMDIAGVNYTISLAGGDYFDVHHFRDGCLAFIVADVSGHDFGSSIIMLGLRRAFRTAVPLMDNLDELTQILETTITEDSADEFATCFIGRFDPRTRTLTYAGAGHDGLLFHPSGWAANLEATCPPLGTRLGVQLESSRPIPLPPGHTLAVVTDGFNEAPSTSSWQFTRERLKESIARNLRLPAEEILIQLIEEVRTFCGSRMPRDDMSGVVIKSL